ncbi:MAG: hypothetical protein ACYSR0_04305 [Planctomycetota bacterium]
MGNLVEENLEYYGGYILSNLDILSETRLKIMLDAIKDELKARKEKHKKKD